MSFRIGSFNVKNLSFGNSNRDLQRIADLIRDNQFDIIALQEVLSEGKALKGPSIGNNKGQAIAYQKSILGRLGPDWDCRWLDPSTSSKFYPYLGKDSRGEGYAFLWNTRKFELPEKDGRYLEPYIEHRYSTKGENIIRLIRDPAVGCFKVKGRPMEIRLITTHIVFGKPNENVFNADFDIGVRNMRRNEFRILAGWIYKKVNDECLDRKSTARCTVLLGDYNMNLQSSGIQGATICDVMYFDKNGRALTVDEGAPIKMFTLQNQRSTLKGAGIGLANNYDHFTISEDNKKLVGSCEVIDGVSQHIRPEDTTLEQQYDTYRTMVSDHLPIVLELNC